MCSVLILVVTESEKRIENERNERESEAEHRRESCVSCGSGLTEGLVRRYRDEFVLAGVPVWTVSENRNFYCPNCAGEQTLSDEVADNDHDEPAEQTIFEAE